MAYAEPDDPGEQGLERLNNDLSDADRKGRQESAIALRIAGASYTEVAQVLGYASAARARQSVEAGLAATVGEEDRAQQRFLASRRLERLLRGLWKKSTDEESEDQIPAARTALAIIDRHIKLNGLDAPSEHIIYNPGQKEIEAWVMKMTQQVVGSTPEERDIIEAEYAEVYEEQQEIVDAMEEEDERA
jgi:hypothetical protein